MGKTRDWMIRMQERLDIPAQATELEPIIQLTGSREAAVDRQKGLLSFLHDEIDVAVADGMVQICGGDLRIVLMKESRIVVRGRIDQVVLRKENPQ